MLCALWIPWRTFAIRLKAEHKRNWHKVFANETVYLRNGISTQCLESFAFCGRFAYKAGQVDLELSSYQTFLASQTGVSVASCYILSALFRFHRGKPVLRVGALAAQPARYSLSRRKPRTCVSRVCRTTPRRRQHCTGAEHRRRGPQRCAAGRGLLRSALCEKSETVSVGSGEASRD